MDYGSQRSPIQRDTSVCNRKSLSILAGCKDRDRLRYMRLFRTLLWGIAALAAIPSEARAYIDPASGSYLLQILAAAVLGGLFAFRSAWKNVKDFVRSRVTKDK